MWKQGNKKLVSTEKVETTEGLLRGWLHPERMEGVAFPLKGDRSSNVVGTTPKGRSPFGISSHRGFLVRANSGQVILENAIVFVSLTVLVVASLNLFSGLNFNMLNRMDKFRQSRTQALNSPNSAPTPLSFLDREPYDPLSLNTSYSTFDYLFSEDPYIEEAERLSEKSNEIFTKILPYQVNQVYDLDQTTEVVAIGPNAYKLRPEYNLPTIKELISVSIGLARDVYNYKYQAISKMQKALDEPIIPGTFDPNPEEHPALYGLDPAKDQTSIAQLKQRNEKNRDNLKKSIASLKSGTAQLKKSIDSQVIPRLEYTSQYIEMKAAIGSFSGMLYTRVIKKLKTELIDGVFGRIIPAILSGDLVSKIEKIYSLSLNDNPSKEDVISLKADVDIMLLSQGALNSTGSHPSTANYDIEAEVQRIHNEYPQLKIEDIRDMVNQQLNQQGTLNNDILKQTFGALSNGLEHCLEYWEKYEGQKQDTEDAKTKKKMYEKIKDYYYNRSRIFPWTLYKLTVVNRILDKNRGIGSGIELPEMSFPGSTLPGDASSEEMLPEETLSEEVLPEEVLPEQTSPEEALPEEKSPQSEEQMIKLPQLPENIEIKLPNGIEIKLPINIVPPVISNGLPSKIEIPEMPEITDQSQKVPLPIVGPDGKWAKTEIPGIIPSIPESIPAPIILPGVKTPEIKIPKVKIPKIKIPKINIKI